MMTGEMMVVVQPRVLKNEGASSATRNFKVTSDSTFHSHSIVIPLLQSDVLQSKVRILDTRHTATRCG